MHAGLWIRFGLVFTEVTKGREFEHVLPLCGTVGYREVVAEDVAMGMIFR